MSLVESRITLLESIAKLESVRVLKPAPNDAETFVSNRVAVSMILAGQVVGRFDTKTKKLRHLREVVRREEQFIFERTWRNSEAAVLQPCAVTGNYCV